MDFYFFNNNEQLLFISDSAVEAKHEEEKNILTAKFKMENEKNIKNDHLIGFYDIDNHFNIFKIVKTNKTLNSDFVSIIAYNHAINELSKEIVLDIRNYDKEASYCIDKVLTHTRWNIGTIESTVLGDITHYDTNVWQAIKDIVEKFNIGIKFTWGFNIDSITERKVHVYNRLGADRGKRFEIGKDIQDLNFTYDDSSIVTALYGRGKGVEVGQTVEGSATYGRKLNFSNVEWSVANGDPADKPLGQEYVEDATSTIKYGVCGRPLYDFATFSNEEDELELLKSTYEKLEELKKPKVNLKIKVLDLEKYFGYSHEAVRLGDDVLIVADCVLGNEIEAQIIKITRDLLNPTNTAIEVGNYIYDFVENQVQIQSALKQVGITANIGGEIAINSPSFLQGFIDTTKTMIMSSGTTFYTESDGSFIFITSDGTKAVKIAGAGILIADSKVGDEWQWRTAITGEGVAADEIIAGTLRTSIAFAGQLIATFGTFTSLTAGDTNSSHMFSGTTDADEGAVQMRGMDGVTVNTEMTKHGFGFGDHGVIKKFEMGDIIGYGGYI